MICMIMIMILPFSATGRREGGRGKGDRVEMNVVCTVLLLRSGLWYGFSEDETTEIRGKQSFLSIFPEI
jgi:hypothetical protein